SRSFLTSLALLQSSFPLPPLHLSDHTIKLVEARLPEPAIPLDPLHLVLEPPRAEPTGPHPPDLLRRHEPSPLEDPDVLFHARQGHLKPLCEVRDRGVPAAQLLQNPAPGRVGQRRKRDIEPLCILNHSVQCLSQSRTARKRRLPRCASSPYAERFQRISSAPRAMTSSSGRRSE